MKTNRLICLLFVAAISVFTSACFSIDQEIFLNRDGSGEMIVHFSLPDFPEELKTEEPGKRKDNPEDMLKQFKSELLTGLPPTVKLKELKEVHQNGAEGFYAVFQFKQLGDMQAMIANVQKQKGGETMIPMKSSQGLLKIEKRENRTNYTQSFFIDVSQEGKKTETKESGAATSGQKEEKKQEDEFEKELQPLFLSLVKMRFVLHAPAPITDTNADIVINGNTALWDTSMAAFLKNKKPIEMKASF